MQSVKSYFLSCCFHGVHFIVDSRYHWSERIFWMICVFLAWCMLGFVMISYYTQFANSAISFTIDTTYLKWKSMFPAVIFCERGNMKYLNYLDSWFGENRDYDVDDFVKDIVFFKGSLSVAADRCITENMEVCSSKNYPKYIASLRSSCPELLQHCSWNNQVFNCCDYALPIETVYGVCFATNSDVTRKGNHKSIDMSVSHKSGDGMGTLSIELLNPDVKIFVLDSEEIPYYSEEGSVVFDGTSLSSHYKEEISIYLAIEEMVNEKEVFHTSITRRGCVLPNEIRLSTSRIYSYSACIIECLSKMQLEICRCNHHFMPGAKKENMCNLDGLKCLSAKLDEMMARTASCNCQGSCNDGEIKVLGSKTIQHYSGFHHENSTTKLNFILRAPTVRYIRKVVNGYLNLIVCFGGTAGLCVGASLLTIVEIFYHLIIRPLTNNIKSIRQGRHLRIGPFPFVH